MTSRHFLIAIVALLISSTPAALGRVLDAETGRWFTRDPLGYLAGPSLYQYVRSQPLEFSDPAGLIELPACWRGTLAEYLRGIRPGGREYSTDSPCSIRQCCDLRPDNAHIPSSNGCGPPGLRWYLVPNKPFGIDVLPCCDTHDFCYDTCDLGSRLDCDDGFCNCLFAICVQYPAHSWDWVMCRETAKEYCEWVRLAGAGNFCPAQRSACICCDNLNPNPQCALPPPPIKPANPPPVPPSRMPGIWSPATPPGSPRFPKITAWQD